MSRPQSLAPIAVCTVLTALSSAAQADFFTYTGSSAGAPTYSRPFVDFSGLSPNGAGAHYRSLDFTVSVSGDYSFLSTALFDNFSFLYTGAFNAATPLVNGVAGNDDAIGFTTSALVATLTAGTHYSFVTTGFSADEFGAFSNTIGGPGTVDALSAPTPASSQIVTFTGSTAGAPTFSRPFDDFSGLSPNGAGAHYSTFAFHVTTSGDYSFLTTAGFDSFSLLYAGSFDPLSPLANGVAANDDLLPTFTTSAFATTLTAGTEYVLVTTGFSADEFGAFSATIGGPGNVVSAVTAVPEPETYALMLAGLGVLGWAARRRRARR